MIFVGILVEDPIWETENRTLPQGAKSKKLGGVYFWNWYGQGGHEDRSYTPRGKPVQEVLTRRFRKMEALLAEILEKKMKVPPKGLSLTELQGDASYRVYYRLSVPDGQSFIVMKMPEGKASASEEITNLTEKPKELPYINIAR